MNNCYRGYILIAFWVCSLAVYGQTEMQAIDTLRNIRLQEVIVTATQSDVPGTRSVIGQDAICHIQVTVHAIYIVIAEKSCICICKDHAL